MLLTDSDRKRAEDTIVVNHYAHSVPSGKSHYFVFGPVVVVYSIPANKNSARYLIGRDAPVWELSRLWAPDSHEPNLLTRALCTTVQEFRETEPAVVALLSYADPNVGHVGGIYRAASWMYLGQCEEGRYYRDAEGQVVSRRKFHSGSRSLTKAEILARGYQELKLPGKHRFARGLTPGARRAIRRKHRGILS